MSDTLAPNPLIMICLEPTDDMSQMITPKDQEREEHKNTSIFPHIKASTDFKGEIISA